MSGARSEIGLALKLREYHDVCNERILYYKKSLEFSFHFLRTVRARPLGLNDVCKLNGWITLGLLSLNIRRVLTRAVSLC